MSNYTIKRIVNGTVMEFELTDLELKEIHYEHLYYQCKRIIVDNLADMGVDESVIDPEYFVDYVNDAVDHILEFDYSISNSCRYAAEDYIDDFN